MDANIHDTNSIVLGNIKEGESSGKPYFTRTITICRKTGEDENISESIKSERVLYLTLFADSKADLEVEVSSTQKI